MLGSSLRDPHRWEIGLDGLPCQAFANLNLQRAGQINTRRWHKGTEYDVFTPVLSVLVLQALCSAFFTSLLRQ